MLAATKLLSPQNYVYRHNFVVAMKDVFCHDKHMFVVTKIMFVATKICRNKSMPVATKDVLTKMILVAAPASDTRSRL